MGLNLVSVDIPPGLNSDDTTYSSDPSWVDMSLMRWRKGRAQVVGGWQSLTLSLLGGVCRSVLSWTDLANTQNIAFGMHNGLSVWTGGALSTISPGLQLPSATLPANPLAWTNGSAVYTVNHPGHGYVTGETIALSGAQPAGRQTLSGNYVITVTDANHYTITAAAAAVGPHNLGATALSVSNASTLVTVTDTAHNLANGASVAITGSAAVGGITPNGTFTITVVDANTYSFNFTSAATSTTTGGGGSLQSWAISPEGGSACVVQNLRGARFLGANPFWTQGAGSPLVVVTDAGHPYQVGDQVAISGAVAFNGITPNGIFTVIDTSVAGQWRFNAANNATATGFGGGSAIQLISPRQWVGGAIDGAGSAGYGTGAYNTGGYGQPSSTTYYAMTWSLAAWGANLIANPRGQGIYLWANSGFAAPLANAPQNVAYTLVTQQRQVMALGCNDEVTGIFNPMLVRHSGVQNNTQWATLASSASTARSYQLPGGGRIVAGVAMGAYVLIWTNFGLFLGTYVGNINQVWSFNPVATGCGLIGPNAFTVIGNTAYWMSPDKQFWAYTLGGMPQTLDCPILADLRNNMALAQADKIVMSHLAQFGEIWCFYPDARDGYENSRYVGAVAMGADVGEWFRGRLSRTAFCDAGPYSYPIGVSFGGAIYEHEHGNSADGSPLSWFLTSSTLALDQNFSMLARKFFPDFSTDQIGAVQLTINTTMSPNDQSPRSFGPYTIAKGQTEADILAEGRFFNLTFSGNSYPSYARMGRLLFDAKPRGRR